MKFCNKIKANWHDTDAQRNVRPSKIVEYMQETANRQCESSNLPLEKLRDERGLAFILGSISLNFYKPLHAYDEIEVRTWCKEAKSYIFQRFFEIIKDGEKVAEATSVWVLIDLNKKTMVRADSYDFLFGSFYYDEPIDQSLLLPKARIPRDAELYEVGKRKIVYSDIDYNMHMNNTKYPDMVCDFLPDPAKTRVTGMSLAYHREAAYGDTMTVERADGGAGVYYFRTKRQDTVCLEAMVKTEPR